MKAANYLHTQPWKLAGIEHDDSNPPVCWQNWAWEIVQTEGSLNRERENAMINSAGA